MAVEWHLGAHIVSTSCQIGYNLSTQKYLNYVANTLGSTVEGYAILGPGIGSLCATYTRAVVPTRQVM
jgi:hypothetical protein